MARLISVQLHCRLCTVYLTHFQSQKAKVKAIVRSSHLKLVCSLTFTPTEVSLRPSKDDQLPMHGLCAFLPFFHLRCPEDGCSTMILPTSPHAYRWHQLQNVCHLYGELIVITRLSSSSPLICPVPTCGEKISNVDTFRGHLLGHGKHGPSTAIQIPASQTAAQIPAPQTALQIPAYQAISSSSSG
jgi:hypothetical protein